MSSIRDVALRTGLSAATVSLALRGLGRISAKTQERVRAAALELNYQPNPLFSRALSQARQPADQRYRETLAFIIEWETENGPEHQKKVYAGALQQASEMGYKLESFVVSGRPSDQRRVSRILRARGIAGMIIISRLGSPHPRLHWDWEHFAAVEIDRTVWHPRNLHHVETAAYPNILEAFHLLKKIGYRRIGMAIEPAQNRHSNGVYYAAYLLWQLRQPVQQRLPIHAPNGPWDETSLRRWVEQHKPDVLVIHATLADLILKWLTNMGCVFRKTFRSSAPTCRRGTGVGCVGIIMASAARRWKCCPSS